MKGFDVYQKIDNLLTQFKIGNIFEFTYIGNLPEGFSFKNSKYLNLSMVKNLV